MVEFKGIKVRAITKTRIEEIAESRGQSYAEVMARAIDKAFTEGGFVDGVTPDSGDVAGGKKEGDRGVVGPDDTGVVTAR